MSCGRLVQEYGNNMKILWIPHTAWYIPQRANLFCHKLSERHEIHVTDWDGNFSKLSDFFSVHYIGNFCYRFYRDKNVNVHGIPRISPTIMSASLRRLNQRIFSKYIQKIVDEYSINTVVGTFVAPPPKAGRVIFDLFDDNVAYWRRFGRGSTYADEIEAVELEYMATADAIIASSTALVEKAKRIAPNTPIYLIPNGIDISQYKKADGHKFRSHFQISGKLIGNVGNHDKRNEMEFMLNIAALMRNEPLTFLIAGRGNQLEWTQKQAKRLGLTNIRFYGAIPFDNLPDVMNALDVGLCPYEKTEGADASSPMRLVSYLASKVPVVCTDLKSVRTLKMENVVLVSDTPEAFVKGIRKALTLPRMMPKKLMELNLPQLAEKYERALSGEDV